MKNPRLIEVHWKDSAFHRGWSSAATKRSEMGVALCRTAGYLVESTKECVKVAHSVDHENESFADGIAIPRVAITKIRRLQ